LNILSRLILATDDSPKVLADVILNKFRLLSSEPSANDNLWGIITITGADKIISRRGFCYLGQRYLYSSDRLMILDNSGAACTISNILANNIEIIVESGFKPDEFAALLEDIIFCRLIQHDVLPVHSAAMHFRGKGFLFPAWGGTGKTGILLGALETPDAVISDEWNFITGNTIYPFSDKLTLMYYDILKFSKYASGVEALRAKLYKTVAKKNHAMLSVLMEKLKVTLRCKEVKLSDLCSIPLSPFPLDHVAFIKKVNTPDTEIVDCLPGEIADFVTVNFFREKQSLFQFMNICSLIMPDHVNAVTFFTEKYRYLAGQIFQNHVKALLLPASDPGGLIKILDDEFAF
jgi:hypothetical protein